MPFKPGDPVYACLHVQNKLTATENDSTKRLFRDVIQIPGKWQPGDTLKVKSSTYIFFGNQNSTLSSNVSLLTSKNKILPSTTTGQGTGELTITLTGSAPDGDTIQVFYRIGVPCTYDELLQNRGNDQINLHKVTLNGGPKDYVDIYNQPHKLAGTNALLRSINSLDGISIQTNPPA